MTVPGDRPLHLVLFYCFAAFVFCSTFSIAASQIALGMALVIFLVIVFWEKHQPFVRPLRRFYLFVALYVAWLFVTAATGETPLRSMWILKEEWLFLIIPIGIFLFRNERFSERLILTLAASLVLISVYGCIQHFTGVYWFKREALTTMDESVYRLSGNFSHPLTFGNYMVTASLFCLGLAFSRFRKPVGWKHVLIITAGLLGALTTAIANSRGPALALMCGLILLSVLVRRLSVALIGLALVVVIATSSSPGFVDRLEEKFRVDTKLRYEGGRFFIWNNSLKIIRDHPILGVGQGNFKTEYVKHLRPDIGRHRKYTHAHCDILNVAAIAGIPGLILYLGLWGAILASFWRCFRNNLLSDGARSFCLAAFLASIVFGVTSLTEATFADEEVRQLLMLFWAVGLSVSYKDKEKLTSTANVPIDST